MMLLGEQLTLPVLQSVGCLLPKWYPKRKRAREKRFSLGRNRKQLSHSFKKEPIIALWQLCSFLFQRSRSGVLPGTQNFVTDSSKGASFTCHSPLLRFLSHPFLSLSLFLCLFLATLTSPIVNEKGNKQLRFSLDWMRCVAWTTEGQAWGVWCWTRLEKCEEVDVFVFVCVLDTPTEPPGWRGLTAEWADWHTDTLHQSLNPPASSSSASLPLLVISSIIFLFTRSVMLMICSALGPQLHKPTDGDLSINFGMVIEHTCLTKTSIAQSVLTGYLRKETLTLNDMTFSH